MIADAKPKPILLLTGFEPFDSFDSNPSWEAADEVAKRLSGSVVALRLPVDYFESRRQLITAIADINPITCLCMGLAPFDEFRLEEVARKPKEFAGLRGKSFLRGTWPWVNTETILRSERIPYRRSHDAGQYVCESTYWSLLDFGGTYFQGMHMGFMHVPALSPLFPLRRTADIVYRIVNAYVSASLLQRQIRSTA